MPDLYDVFSPLALKGRVAVIAGADTELGAAAARTFAATGARLVLAGDPARCPSPDAPELLPYAHAIALMPAEPQRAVAAAVEGFGSLDLLLTVDVSPVAVLRWSQIAARAMAEGGRGAIIHAATLPPGYPADGFRSTARSLAAQFTPQGIRVNAVTLAPGTPAARAAYPILFLAAAASRTITGQTLELAAC